MFDNIGRKIKGLASAVTWIGIILSIISGISMLSSSGGLLAIPAILVMALGSLFSWLASLTLYGFGQLIENSDIIAEEYNRKNEKHEKAVAKSNEKKQAQRQKQAKENMEDLNFGEDEYIDITCSSCKAELSFTKGQLQSSEKLTCPLCDAPISV